MKILRRHLTWAIFFAVLLSQGIAHAAGEVQPSVLTITQAYIDLHTGPGDSFPVFSVVERGGKIALLAEQGAWYKVRSERREIGWLSGASIATDVVQIQTPIRFSTVERATNARRAFALGLVGGAFGNDMMYGLSLSYHMLWGLHLETNIAQSAGKYSMSNYYSAGVQWYLWQEQRFSPGIFVSAGGYSGRSQGTVIPAVSVQDEGFVATGLSMRMRVTDRLFVRTGIGIFSSQQVKNVLQNDREWQASVHAYF